MSRSYKKTPYAGDNKGKRKKRTANHVVRQFLKKKKSRGVVLQNNLYKKLYETWDICDYGYICTWEEYWRSEQEHYHWLLARYPNKAKKPNKKESYRKWLKWYRNK